MNMNDKPLRPIWLNDNPNIVNVIDQRYLPHEFRVLDLVTMEDVIFAIQEMVVRGAPLIGATGAFGVYLITVNAVNGLSDHDLKHACKVLKAARPTAVNLSWAVDRVLQSILPLKNHGERIDQAKKEALLIAEEEAENCRKIGEHGLTLIRKIHRKKQDTVNVLTHCNAGWLACVEYGTATAPIYAAYDKGIDIHVWVDETRPLNQGARLTAWELGQYGVNHTIITDNAGGHLMQHGLVDLVIVGTDRTTCTGDVANKIGTYLKALAARDNNVPFYVALPSSTFDWQIKNGMKDIPIEQRDSDEVRYVQGLDKGEITRVLITPAESAVSNYAFDVTPARLVTGFITERGICKADEQDIQRLFPEKKGI